MNRKFFSGSLEWGNCDFFFTQGGNINEKFKRFPPQRLPINHASRQCSVKRRDFETGTCVFLINVEIYCEVYFQSSVGCFVASAEKKKIDRLMKQSRMNYSRSTDRLTDWLTDQTTDRTTDRATGQPTNPRHSYSVLYGRFVATRN